MVHPGREGLRGLPDPRREGRLIPTAPTRRVEARPPAGPYALVVFDFDGTLADSFAWFAGVLGGVADRYRFRRPEPAEVEALQEMSAAEIMARLGVARWKLPFIARHMHRLAARDAAAIGLFPGIASMLAGLSLADVPLAVLSSNHEANVRAVLGPAQCARFGTLACGASIFGKARRLRRLLAATGVPADRALYVGDEIRDLDAARAVGCAFGAVTWGYTRPRALLAAGPDVVFSEPAAIVRALTGHRSG